LSSDTKAKNTKFLDEGTPVPASILAKEYTARRLHSKDKLHNEIKEHIIIGYVSSLKKDVVPWVDVHILKYVPWFKIDVYKRNIRWTLIFLSQARSS
jgi:hypothetical protein